MQTLLIQNTQLQFPMQELEQIESIIQASQHWFATLEGRRATLRAELDRITRPQPISPQTLTKTIRRGFEYRGVVYEHWYNIDMHLDLLRRLWTEFPERREAMARAMGRNGRKRTYIAKTLAELFPGQPSVFAKKHGRILVEDWYVDTNMGPKQMRTILPVAVAAAGLKFGEEVKIYWQRTQIS